MHNVTQALRDRLLDPTLSPAAKIELLHNAYAGATAFVLACGPSLNEYKPEELARLLKSELVLCIKQSFDHVQAECDFLLLNSWNFRRYEFHTGRPIIIREAGAKDPPVYLAGDIELAIPKPSSRDDQLALSKRFDDYTFSRTIQRPWGPGVLYELGFYLAEHVGARKIVTLGWDVGVKNSPQMPHFYDTTSPATVALIRKSRDIDDLAERNRFLHDNGVVYNRPRIIPEEVEDCAAVSADWAAWLAARDIELKLVSRHSLAAASIPRTRIEAELSSR